MKKACHYALSRTISGGNHSVSRLHGFAKHRGQVCLRSSAFLHAFTLLETMIAVALFGLVVAGTIEMYIMCNKIWRATSLQMQTSQMADMAISKMVAGYGTNMGLRGANMIAISTNFHGWPYTINYWETNGQPPSSDSHVHHICSCSYQHPPRDGSWRMIVSNSFNGVSYIEYNAPVRLLLFCPVTDLGSYARLTTAAEQQRTLICSHVSESTITNFADGSLEVKLTVYKRDGNFVSSNKASVFINNRY